MSILTEQEKYDLVMQTGGMPVGTEFVSWIESKVIEKIKAQGAAARTVASVTNTGYVYIEALERTIPFKTNLYRLPEGD